MRNALFADKRRDDFEETKREIRTISEKLESQLTLGEEGIDITCILRFYWTYSLDYSICNAYCNYTNDSLNKKTLRIKLLVTSKCELRFKMTQCLFDSGNSGDNLEYMKKEIADIKEKLDILMNRPPLGEKKLKMEGKVHCFGESEADNWTAPVVVLVRFRVVYNCNFLSRG